MCNLKQDFHDFLAKEENNISYVSQEDPTGKFIKMSFRYKNKHN
mgnify:CR=1 FL=1